MWEEWEAGIMAFHAFHTLSFPWPAFSPVDAGFTPTSASVMGSTRKDVFVVIAFDEYIRDSVLIVITVDLARVYREFSQLLAYRDPRRACALLERHNSRWGAFFRMKQATSLLPRIGPRTDAKSSTCSQFGSPQQ